MPERPLQFSLAAAVGALSLSAIALGIGKLGGERVLWGVFSVIGLAGLGIAIALVGGRSLGLSISGGSAVGLSAFLMSGLVAENHHGILLLTSAILVWACWAYFAIRGVRAFRLLQIAMGLTWSFLAALSLLISIQNAGDSVVWPRMIPALLLAPFAFFLPMLPFWGIRRWLRRTRSPTMHGRWCGRVGRGPRKGPPAW